MLVRKSIPMLAAAVTLFGASTPAYAFDSQSAGAPPAPQAPVTAAHPAGSSELPLELAVGGLVVAGGGLAAWQLRRRPTRQVRDPRTVSGS